MSAPPAVLAGIPAHSPQSAPPSGSSRAYRPQGAHIAFPHLAPPSRDWGWAPVVGCKGGQASRAFSAPAPVLRPALGVSLPILHGTINGHRALPRAPPAFVRGLWCLLPRGRFSSEPPFLCPFSDTGLANRWQRALLGMRSELGLATSGPCWAERRLRPGEAHTWGGRLAGSGGADAGRLGLSPVSERRDAGQATRGEGSAWTAGHGNPKSWAQTQYRGNPDPWRRWGGGSEKIACPHGGM